MSIGSFQQQPAERLDYDIDCSDWLATGDAIENVTVDISPSNLLNPQKIISGNKIKLWISGGVNNVTYKVSVTIETKDTRIKQVEFKIKVKDS